MTVIKDLANNFICSDCKLSLVKQKYIILGKEFTFMVYQCDCLKKQDNLKYIREAGFHEKHLDLIINGKELFDKNKIMASVKDYYKNMESLFDKKIGLFIIGSTGIGKTISIIWLLKQIVLKFNRRVRYITHSQLTDIHRSYLAEDKNKYDIYKKSRILFIDDILPKQGQLYDIVDYRANNNLLTFYASNVDTVEDMKEILGEATLSRIKGSCIFDILDDGIKDMRELSLGELIKE